MAETEALIDFCVCDESDLVTNLCTFKHFVYETKALANECMHVDSP